MAAVLSQTAFLAVDMRVPVRTTDAITLSLRDGIRRRQMGHVSFGRPKEDPMSPAVKSLDLNIADTHVGAAASASADDGFAPLAAKSPELDEAHAGAGTSASADALASSAAQPSGSRPIAVLPPKLHFEIVKHLSDEGRRNLSLANRDLREVVRVQEDKEKAASLVGTQSGSRSTTSSPQKLGYQVRSPKDQKNPSETSRWFHLETEEANKANQMMDEYEAKGWLDPEHIDFAKGFRELSIRDINRNNSDRIDAMIMKIPLIPQDTLTLPLAPFRSPARAIVYAAKGPDPRWPEYTPFQRATMLGYVTDPKMIEPPARAGALTTIGENVLPFLNQAEQRQWAQAVLDLPHPYLSAAVIKRCDAKALTDEARDMLDDKFASEVA